MVLCCCSLMCHEGVICCFRGRISWLVTARSPRCLDSSKTYLYRWSQRTNMLFEMDTLGTRGPLCVMAVCNYSTLTFTSLCLISTIKKRSIRIETTAGSVSSLSTPSPFAWIPVHRSNPKGSPDPPEKTMLGNAQGPTLLPLTTG